LPEQPGDIPLLGGRAVKFSYLVEKQEVARSHVPRGNAKARRSASIAAERQIPRSDAERRNENLTALPSWEG